MQNSKKLSVLLVLVMVAGFISCTLSNAIYGNGNITSQERTAEGFNSIVLDGVGDIYVHFAENYRVVVSTDSNIQDYIIVKTDNKDLHIDDKYDTLQPTKLILDIYVPEIKSINLKGVGNVHISNGNGNDVALYLHGVGDIIASDYQVRNGAVDLTGVGTIKIWATDYLHGNLKGVGNIFYKGNPELNVTVTGIGKINAM